MQYFLGIDCGLTAVKAAIVDERGRLLSEHAAATPLQGLYMNGKVLRDRVFECVREAIRKSGVNSARISAVGLSGHGNGLYALDENDDVVIAVSSMFDLNQAAVNEFQNSKDYQRFIQITNQFCWGGQPMQILKDLKARDICQYNRIRSILFCKDYIRFCLTGEKVTDYSDFAAGALGEGELGAELCEMLGISEMVRAMPVSVRCDEIAGRVTAGAAAASGLSVGTPVVGGGIDLYVCMTGVGITAPGCCSVTAGTWGVTAAFSDDIANLSQLTQCCRFLPDISQAAIVSGPTSCVNLEWFMHSIRPELTFEEANEIALSYAPDEVKMLYLPYLYRDMAHPAISGAFRDLSPSDTWREMLRAVFEGVCFAHRLQLDRLRAAGVQIDRVRMSGGATQSKAWRRIMCDILGVPLEIPSERQAGLVGASMMAAVGTGIYTDLEEAARSMTSINETCIPENTKAYEEKYQQFLRMVGETL